MSRKLRHQQIMLLKSDNYDHLSYFIVNKRRHNTTTMVSVYNFIRSFITLQITLDIVKITTKIGCPIYNIC